MTAPKEAIRILRKEACMTQKELAQELNFSCISVKRWEAGKTVPDTTAASRLLALANTKDVSGQCKKHLADALRSVRQDALNMPNSNLYSVDRDSICRLVDDSPNAVFVCNFETDELLYVNHKAEEYTGRPFLKGQSQTCYQYFHGRTEPCLQCPKYQLNDRVSTVFHQVSPATGRHYHVSGKKIVWNGIPAHAQYLFDETTSLELHGGLEQLVNELDAGVITCWIYDGGRIQIDYVSDGYFAVSGTTRQERAQQCGCGIMNVICEQDRGRLLAESCKACREQRSFNISYRITAPDNTEKRLFMRARFIRREQERSLYSCVITGDD